jgi:hypothetical protein
LEPKMDKNSAIFARGKNPRHARMYKLVFFPLSGKTYLLNRHTFP